MRKPIGLHQKVIYSCSVFTLYSCCYIVDRNPRRIWFHFFCHSSVHPYVIFVDIFHELS